MATHYARGVVTERRAKDELEAEGYHVTRAASSKGSWDLIAIAPAGIRLISSKRAQRWDLAQGTLTAERRKLRALLPVVPANATQEVWLWTDKGPDGKGPGRWFTKEVIAP